MQHSFLDNVGGYFFTWAKHLIGYFSGFFIKISTFFISIKNPSIYQNKCFARLKKITTGIFKESIDLIVIKHAISSKLNF